MEFLLWVVLFIVLAVTTLILAEVFKILFKARFEKSILELTKKNLGLSIIVLLVLYVVISLFLVPHLKSLIESRSSKKVAQPIIKKHPDSTVQDTNKHGTLLDTLRVPVQKSDSTDQKPMTNHLDSATVKVFFKNIINLKVQQGDTILISANGTIDQDKSLYKDFGLDSIIEKNGISLSSYDPNGLKNVSSIVKVIYRFNYGALLVSIGDDSWKFCGKHLRFLANSGGSINLLINSAKRATRQDDQYFSVSIKVLRNLHNSESNLIKTP